MNYSGLWCVCDSINLVLINELKGLFNHLRDKLNK